MAITKYQAKVNGKLGHFYKVSVDTRSIYTGKRKTKRVKGFKTIGEAKIAEKDLWHYCRHYKPGGVSDLKTWGELKRTYLYFVDENSRCGSNPDGFSQSTVKSKFSRLKQTAIWDDLHIELVTPMMVREWLDSLENEGKSRHATNTLLKEIKAVFNHAVELGLKDSNPMANFRNRRERQKKKNAFTHEEANKLLNEAKKRGHPFYYIWLLSIGLGLRRSELAGLMWTDVDWERGLLTIQRQKIPSEGLVDYLKSGRDRVVAIPRVILPEMKQLKLSSSSDFIIDNTSHEWVSGHQARVLRQFCREIGLKEVSHHSLRATHITLALVDGVPLGIVKENVGHSKLSTTDIYFRSSGISMAGQMDGLSIKVPSPPEGKVLRIKDSNSR